MESFQLGFRKANVPTGLLGVPGVFKIPIDPCCLACALTKLDKFSLLHAVLKETKTTNDIANLEDDFIKGTSRADSKFLKAICRTIIEFSGNYQLPIFHGGFFQRSIIQLNSPNAGYDITNGRIRKGEVLEIFMATAMTPFVFHFLRGINLQALGVRVSLDRYRNVIDHLPLASSLRITPQSSSCIHNFYNQNGIQMSTRYRFTTNVKEPQDEQFLSMQRVFIGLKSVSLIIVEPLESCLGGGKVEDYPCVNTWLECFKNAFGDLDGVIVVFLVNYTRFLQEGISELETIRKTINRNVTGGTREKIKCLEIPRYGVINGNPLALPVFPLLE